MTSFWGVGGEFKSDLFIEKVPSQDFYMVGVLEKAKGLGILDSTDLQIDLWAFFPIIVLLSRLLIVIFRGGCQERFDDLFLLHVFSVFDDVCHIPQNLLATLSNEGTVVTCLYQRQELAEASCSG